MKGVAYFQIFTVCALLVITPPVIARDVEIPRVSVPNVKSDFHLDGQLDEPFWQKIPVQSDFHIVGNVKPSQDISRSTSFRVVRHGDTLIFGFICRQPEAEVSIATTECNLPSVCSDDSVEVFLRHNDEGFYQFAVNAGGYFYARYAPSAHGANRALWEGAWAAAVHREKDQWSVEIAIPFAALNWPENRSVKNWFFNAARTWGRERIFQSYAPVQASFGDWKKHARLVFENPIPVPSAFHVSQTTWPLFLYGKNSGEISVGAPESHATYSIKASLRNWVPGALPARETLVRNLRSKDGKLTIPLELTVPLDPSSSLRELILEIVDETTNTAVGLLAHTFQPPELLQVQMDWPVYYTTDKKIPVHVTLNAAEPADVASKILLTLVDGDDKAVWEETQNVLSGSQYTFQIPIGTMPPDLYRVQVGLSSSKVKVAHWSGSFQLVSGPYSLPSETHKLKQPL